MRDVCQVQQVQPQIQVQSAWSSPAFWPPPRAEDASEGSDLDGVIAALKGKGQGRQETRECYRPRVQVRAERQSTAKGRGKDDKGKGKSKSLAENFIVDGETED